ncbi:MAG: Uncharacterised protein [Cellulomonadaceae bacterium TMED98]|nr:MAG: Uncharacterised protein [Cellulomonadaceae bacterium TMED98]
MQEGTSQQAIQSVKARLESKPSLGIKLCAQLFRKFINHDLCQMLITHPGLGDRAQVQGVAYPKGPIARFVAKQVDQGVKDHIEALFQRGGSGRGNVVLQFLDCTLKISPGQRLQHGQPVREIPIDGADRGTAAFCQGCGGERLQSVLLDILCGRIQDESHPLGAPELNRTHSDRTVARNFVQLVVTTTHEPSFLLTNQLLNITSLLHHRTETAAALEKPRRVTPRRGLLFPHGIDPGRRWAERELIRLEAWSPTRRRRLRHPPFTAPLESKTGSKPGGFARRQNAAVSPK